MAALTAPPAQVAIDGSARKLYTADASSGSVLIWDTTTGKLLLRSTVPGVTGPVAVFPNGQIAVAIREAKGPLRGTPPTPEPIDNVRLISPDGMPTGVVFSFPDTDVRRTITSLAATPDGKMLLAGTFTLTRTFGGLGGELPAQGGEVAAWNLKEPKKPARRLVHAGAGIRKIVASAAVTGLAVLARGNPTSVLFSYTGTATKNPDMPSGPTLPRIGFESDTALSPDGKWLAVATGDRVMIRPASDESGSEAEWVVKSGPRPVQGTARVVFLAGSPTRLAVLTRNELHMVNLDTRAAVSTPFGSDGEMPSDLIAGGTDGLVIVRRDGRSDVFDIAQGRTTATIPVVRREPVRLASADDYLLMAEFNGNTSLWDNRKGEMIWSAGMIGSRNSAALFSSDGGQVFLASQLGDLVSLDAKTGKPRWSTRQPGGFGSVALSPDGKVLAAASTFPAEIRMFDSATGAANRTILLSKAALPSSLAFSPDGKVLAAINRINRNKSEIALFDSSTGSPTREPMTVPRGETIQFTSNGDALILTNYSPGYEAAVVTVPLSEQGAPRRVVVPLAEPNDPPRRFLVGVTRMVISRDGQTVALGHVDGSVSVCDTTTGGTLWKIAAHPSSVPASATGGGGLRPLSALSFSGGKSLAVSSERAIRFFDIKNGKLQKTLRFVDTGKQDETGGWVWTSPDGKWGASPTVLPLVESPTPGRGRN